jgi:hypothetical protein
LLAAGISSPGVLDELEAHLREDMDRQMKLGTTAQQAFATALLTLGKAHSISVEFKKCNRASSIVEKLMIGICFVFVGFIIFLGAATVILCFGSWQERVVAAVAMVSSLLVACSWRYAVPLLPVITNKRLRWGVGLACIASGFLCSSFFCEVILPHFEISSDQQRFEIALWAVFLIAVFFCAGVGLLLTQHEREVRGMTKSRFRLSASSHGAANV